MKKADMELFAREHEIRRKIEKETREKILVSLIKNAVEQRRDEDFLLGLEKAATFVIKYGFSHNDQIMIFYKSMDTDCVNYRRMIHVMEYLGLEMSHLDRSIKNISWQISDATYMHENIKRFEKRKRSKFVEYLYEHFEEKTLLQIACELINLEGAPSDIRTERDKKTAETNRKETSFYILSKDKCEVAEITRSYEQASYCATQYMNDNMSLSELSDINDCFVTSDAIFLANYECCCNARVSDIIKLARLLNLNKNENSSLVTDPRWASVKRYDPNGYKMVRLLKTLGLISLPYCVTFDI